MESFCTVKKKKELALTETLYFEDHASEGKIMGPFSMVHYAPPIPIKDSHMGKSIEDMLLFSQTEEIRSVNNKAISKVGHTIAKHGQNKMKTRSSNFAEECSNARIWKILNSILPSRRFTIPNKNNNQSYTEMIQFPSLRMPDREDIIRLEEKLDAKLIELQGQASGLCCVRENLFSQTIDEILRQVTLSCPERGLLLLRLRDELRMTISAYRTIAHDSSDFGICKATEGEEKLKEYSNLLEKLENERNEKKQELLLLKYKKQMLEKQVFSERDKRRKRFSEECAVINEQNMCLQDFVKNYKENFS